MNFIRDFVGKATPDNFSRQMERFLALGAGKQLCFGADFYCTDTDDISPAYRQPPNTSFFPSFDHAGTYPLLLDLWRKHGVISEEGLLAVSYDNLERFLSEQIIH